MKNEEIDMEKVTKMAEDLQRVSEAAGQAGKQAITDTIDKADELSDQQKIGAMVMASTAVYAAVLMVISKRKMPEGVRQLARDLYTSLVVPELEKLDD